MAKSNLRELLDDVEQFLKAKNARYGNSVLDPVRIFSSCSDEEQILVRIDDKLSRIKAAQGAQDDEDTLLDLLGYLVILLLRRRGHKGL